MKQLLRKIGWWILKIAGALLLLSLFWVLLYRWLDPPVTYLMIDRYFAAEWGEGKLDKEWKDMEEISPHLGLSVVAAEDQKFLEHNGFDFEAIQKAIENNAAENRKSMKGGSTISQQVAKNVFLWPTRSWFRKGLEVYFTFLVELCWDKHRILEVYLNVVEMGRGVYGAEAASHYYFGKSAEHLSRGEAALIAAILPNPREYRVKNPTTYIQKRQRWIMSQMRNLGPLAWTTDEQ